MKKIRITQGLWAEDYWLVDYCPDWQMPVELTFEMISESSRGLTEREAGRRVYERLRVAGFSYTTWLDGRAAQECHAALRNRRREKLLVPLWPLARRSAEYHTAPWRAEIYAAYDIVQGEVVMLAQWRGRTTPTHVSTTPTSFTVPCVVADFADGKWPTLEHMDDEAIEVEFAIEEQSLAEFSIEVQGYANAYGPLPDGWPLLIKPPTIFPLLPNWEKSPITEHTYANERARIGYSRVPVEVNNETVPVRQLEWECHCMTHGEVAVLVAFFQNVGGSAGRFWAPGSDAQCFLSADVKSSSTTLDVADANQLQVGRWLAFVDPYAERVQISRVAAVPSPGTLALTEPVSDCPAARTSVMEAVLWRFSKTQLTLTFDTDESAQALLSFREVPAETMGVPGEAMGQQLPRTSLYTLSDEVSGAVWRYTSYERALSWGGAVFTPYVISHGAMVQTITLEDECKLQAELRDGSAFMGVFRLTVPRLSIKIERVLLNAVLEPASVLRTFIGYATDIKVTGAVMQLTVKGQPREIDGVFPRMRFSRLCSYALFSTGCTLSKAAWTLTATVTALSADGRTLTLNMITPEPLPEHFFAWGVIQFATERRMIRANSAQIGSLITMQIEPVPGLSIGDTVSCVPECDGRPQTCKVFNNYANFGGNVVADGNLSLIQISNNQTGGGKK